MTPRAGADVIGAGRATLGIELGSTRIKACLVADDEPATVLAAGSHAWENALDDGFWTYSLESVRSGLQAAYADLAADVQNRHGVQLTRVRAMGVSAMMHGYLPFDDVGELLVPFRTWRNTNTGSAATALTEAFEVNIPLRWSIAHLYQAVLDTEAHVPRVRFLTTLAGYVHWILTGRQVLGVGDASGMFPIDPATHSYDTTLAARFDQLTTGVVAPVLDLLPEVLVAGDPAGQLTAEGAALLDPTGVLLPGVLVCPPEGDAGTGMVATNAVAPRSGNISVGTSVFAMVVLDRPLSGVQPELDSVTTPAGDPVAMVHCNNGASELAAWVGQFHQFAALTGVPMSADDVYDAILHEALRADPDAGGILAYNQLAGEPLVGLTEGRPLVVRPPDSRASLANVARANLYGVFAALAIGMRVLTEKGVVLDRIVGHGGVFRTEGVVQRLLAGALGVPVVVAGDTASEGGAWGMAVLATISAQGGEPLRTVLADRVFAHAGLRSVDPDPGDVAGFAAFLTRYRAGLEVERAAVRHV